MTRLLGREVRFIPACDMVHANGRPKEEIMPIVTGRIDFVHECHGWFRVRWKAGKTIQHECFKFCEIGKVVELVGRRKVDKNHH